MIWGVVAAVVVVCLIVAFLRLPTGARHRYDRAIADMLTRNYSGRHKFRTVVEEEIDQEFGHLDLGYYFSATKVLQKKGFSRQADVENVTVRTSASGPKTFLRMMLGGDGTVTATIYYVVRPGTAGSKVLDLETELSDGTFLVTSNAPAAGAMTSPPTILTEFMDAETPPLGILAHHEEHVRRYLSEHPQVQTIILQSAEDVIESQHRMQDVKVQYRQSLGWITEEEIGEMLKIKGAVAHDTAESIRKLIEADRG